MPTPLIADLREKHLFAHFILGTSLAISALCQRDTITECVAHSWWVNMSAIRPLEPEYGSAFMK